MDVKSQINPTRNARSSSGWARFARSGRWIAALPIPATFRGWLSERNAPGQNLPSILSAPLRLPQLLHVAPGGSGWRRYITLLAFLPTALAILYFGLFATNRYVSEAQFVVRTAAKPQGLTGLGSLLRMTGLSRTDDEDFAVQAFMTSLDAVKQIESELPLAEFYDRPGADFIARYPSIFYGSTIEQFHNYLQWMIDVIYTPTTGITTIRVQAFRPEDAQAVALALLDLGEQLVNRMNDRIYNDAVKVAAQEVDHDQQQLIDAEIALTNFRNKEMMIDADRSSVIVTQLIAKLDTDLSQTKAQLTQIAASSPNSPQVGVLHARVAALQAQIHQERSQISDESTGLAQKLAEYEELNLDRDFARHVVETASTHLDAARIEAQRQQLYLERIVEPHLADYAMMPERLRMVATVFGLNLLGILAMWLIFSGIKEHVAIRE